MKTYSTPEIEVLVFEAEDILAGSNGGNYDYELPIDPPQNS